jgi:hypothetical protein
MIGSFVCGGDPGPVHWAVHVMGDCPTADFRAGTGSLLREFREDVVVFFSRYVMPRNT